MDLTHIRDIFQWFAVGLLIAIIAFWILIAMATSARERWERKALPKHIVKRHGDDYLEWLEKAVNRDREASSGVNRIE